jgi:hypothetical protein
MRKTIVSLTILAALVPAAAFAQNADAAAEARIRAAIDHAASVGVPESLLENKVREGRAKGIAEARIAAAVEHRAEVLARVRTALLERSHTIPGELTADGLTTGALTAAADAHEGGVSLKNLASVYARAGADGSVALNVLADLVASGRASQNALVRVEAALARGGRGLNELRGSADAKAGARIRIGG